MKYLDEQSKIKFELTLLKEASPVKEDLSTADKYAVFLFHGTDQCPVNCTWTDGKLVSDELEDLEPGIYGVRVIWVRDLTKKPTLRKLMRVDIPDLFAVTSTPDESTIIAGTVTMKLTRRAHVFGFDGLDSYELAVLMEKTTLSASEWVANLSEMNDEFNDMKAQVESWATAEAQRQATFEANEATRQSNYASAEGTSSSTKGDGSRWGSYKQAESDRGDAFDDSQTARQSNYTSRMEYMEALYATSEGGATQPAKADGSRWQRFLYALGLSTDNRNASGSMWARFLYAIGLHTDPRNSSGSMWARFNDVVGLPIDRIANKLSMWAYFWSHLGANTDEASSNGTMWARFKNAIAGFTESYNSAESSRNSAYSTAEGNRDDQFTENEATRDASVSTAISEVKESLKETTVTTHNWITNEIVQANTSVRSEWHELLAGDKIETLTNEGVPEGVDLEFIVQNSAGTYSTEPYYRPYTAVAACKVAMYVNDYSALNTAKGTLKLTTTRTVVHTVMEYERKTDEHVQQLEDEMMFYDPEQYSATALDPLTTACLEAKDEALEAAEEAREAVASIPSLDSMATKTYVSGLVGVLSNLSTTVKTNIVAAINELKSDLTSVGLKVGNFTSASHASVCSSIEDIESNSVNVADYITSGAVLPSVKTYYCYRYGAYMDCEWRTVICTGVDGVVPGEYLYVRHKNTNFKWNYIVYRYWNGFNFQYETRTPRADILKAFDEDLREQVDANTTAIASKANASELATKADKSEVSKIADEIQDVDEMFPTQVEEEIDLSEIESVGIFRRGSVGSATSVVVDSWENYRHTSPVELKKGEKISAWTTGGWLSYLVESSDSVGSSYTVIGSVNAGGIGAYEYVAEKDMFVCFSYLPNPSQYVHIFRNVAGTLSSLGELAKENEREIGIIKGGVRDFFDEELNTTLASVNEKMSSPCVVFNIVTDTHITLNDDNKRRNKDTIDNIVAFNKQIKTDGVVHLGDIINYDMPSLGGTNSMIHQYIQKYLADLSKANNLFCIPGNHDGDNAQSALSSRWYADGGRLTRDIATHNGASAYFFKDYNDIKLRCVFLSTPILEDDGYSYIYHPDMLRWLANVALVTENGWNVIFFDHVAPIHPDVYQKNTQYTDLKGLLNAFNNRSSFSGNFCSADFSAKTSGKILCMFCGHTHTDHVANVGWSSAASGKSLSNEFSFPIVTTGAGLLTTNSTGDYGDDTSPSRTDKHYTQDLWDTMVFVPKDKKIYLIRFGAGSDREVDLSAIM